MWIGDDEPEMPGELGVKTLDLGGKRLIPGLIDCHAHLTGGGGEAGYASRVPPMMLSRFTRGGVTSVVGLLGTDDLTRTTAQLVATARGLCEEGLSAWRYTGGYHVPVTTLTGSIRGDIVHIDRILGLGELALSDHRSSQPTFDELLRIASEAHVAGLMTGKVSTVHLHMGDGERGFAMVARWIGVGGGGGGCRRRALELFGHDQIPPLCRGREHTVIGEQVTARARHECGEPFNESERVEADRGRAVTPGKIDLLCTEHRHHSFVGLFDDLMEMDDTFTSNLATVSVDMQTYNSRRCLWGG